jgi:hypothetical protein
MSRCNSCNAEIRWVVLPSGKSMPLDEKPFTAFVLDAEGAQTGSARARSIQVRQSHFSSCPNADEHRRSR